MPARRSWLLLIHQIPPKPDYLRVKVRRRLHDLGAVAIKSTIYALPLGAQSLEDFQWTLREIVKDGGQGAICEAKFVDGLDDEEIDAIHRATREGGGAGRSRKSRALLSLGPRARPSAGTKRPSKGEPAAPARMRGRTWVTRKGVYVDRIASAWLIRRFIDPKAKFKFVADRGAKRGPRELRFDMFDGEFTHEGDRCTFEVLRERFRLDDPALAAIGEIVHDLDLKDRKFRREETSGIEKVIAGIAMAHPEDRARIERGSALLDDLHVWFTRKAPRKRGG
jgi:hypothetical protein